MPTGTILKAFQDGFGGVLGFVGIILALGTRIGKMMAESGGADQIAQTLIRAFGQDKVQWAMMFAAFLVGIPLSFDIGFVLLIPLNMKSCVRGTSMTGVLGLGGPRIIQKKY